MIRRKQKMKNQKYSYSLTERSPEYVKKLKQVQGLEQQIVSMEDELGELRPKIQELENLAVEFELEAILDPKAKGKADKANKELDEAKQKFNSIAGKLDKYQTVFLQIQPELEKWREDAIKDAQKDSRKDHEEVVKEIVRAMRELSKAFQEEAAIRDAILQDIDRFGHIMVPSLINDPGSEDDSSSRLGYLLKELKEAGYNV